MKCLGEHYPIDITIDKVSDILKEVPDNTRHQCFRYSYNIAQEIFYWPRMYGEIQSYILKCELCRKNQPSMKSPIIPLQPLPVITKAWYRMGMDLTGPLIESEGYKYILTFIDHFTK